MGKKRGKVNKKEEQLEEEIKEIKETEERLLRKIDYDLNKKDKVKQKKSFKEVASFSFNDFAQILIGCCVFGLPAFINTSFWDYIPLIKTNLLFYIHSFFIICVILAINYEYRTNISFDPWFIRMLLKRFFYTYFSVLMIILLLLALVGKMRYDLSNLDVFRNFLASQSVGMFGAITFSFLKK